MKPERIAELRDESFSEPGVMGEWLRECLDEIVRLTGHQGHRGERNGMKPERICELMNKGHTECVLEIERLQAEVERLTSSLQRVTDLVRYQRAELHREGLITDDEYAELCAIEGSPKRLEGYDFLRLRELAVTSSLKAAFGPTIELLERVQVCTVGRTIECHPEARHEITRIRAIVEGGE